MSSIQTSLEQLLSQRIRRAQQGLYDDPNQRIMDDLSKGAGHSCPNCSSPSSLHYDDTEAGEQFDALSLGTVTAIMIKDGAVRIVKRGHILAEASLDQLGEQPLTDAVNEFTATSQSLAEREKEKSQLERESKDLGWFVAYEPTLIEREIKRLFPDGTAGKPVDVVRASDDTGYKLLVDGRPWEETAVLNLVGPGLVTRKNALERSKADLNIKTNRLAELKLEIADLQEVLPMQQKKIQHLLEELDRTELNRRLNGNLINLSLNDQGQPVAVVRRKIHEELSELPADLKRQLVAQHLAGDEIPENIQEILGIKEAIKMVAQAISAPKAAPEVEAPKARKSRPVNVRSPKH